MRLLPAKGLVRQGRAPGVGSRQRAADATAGSHHTRPRGSQGAHAGAPGGKMRAVLRRIQRAYFCRNPRAGSRATSVAVRYRRRVHAHVHFAAVFHIKILPVLGRSCDRVWLQNPCGGQDARVLANVRAFPGVVPSEIFCAKLFFGSLCYNIFGTQGGNLSPHCRKCKRHQGDKTRSKNLKLRSFHFFGGFFFKKNLKQK